MAYEHIIRALRTDKANELDMRISPLLGDELKVQIAESVAHTQKFIIQELPNLLILSFRQFSSMVSEEDAQKVKDQIWVTPENAMDMFIDMSEVPTGELALSELHDNG